LRRIAPIREFPEVFLQIARETTPEKGVLSDPLDLAGPGAGDVSL
jgi:hypothetical protein